MNTSANSPATVYSLATLEDTPRRALDLLRGVGSSPAIFRVMTQAGYTTHVHQEGDRLLSSVVSSVLGRQPFVTTTSAAHTAAIDELTTWEKTMFRRLRAAAERFYPDDAEAMFGNLKVSDKMDIALLVKIFLERIADLPDAKSRKPSGILKLFAQRGFGAEEIAHLKKLVSITQAPAPETSDEVLDETELAAQKAARVEMLTALRVWYDDWSETARSVLVRRDHQIRVGLAHRKARATAVVTPPPAPVAPAPVAPAPAAPAPASSDDGPQSRAA